MYSQSAPHGGGQCVGKSFTSRYQGWIHTDRILQCSVALCKHSSDTRGNVTATPCATPSSPDSLKHKAEDKNSNLGTAAHSFPARVREVNVKEQRSFGLPCATHF